MSNEFQSGPGGQNAVKKRINFLGIISLVLFVVYSCYLFYLQVGKGNEYRTKARTIAQKTTILPAQRGEIYDRSYSLPLVINTDSFAVELIPAELPADRRDDVFQRLSRILGISVEDIQKRIPTAYYHLYQPIEILSSRPL